MAFRSDEAIINGNERVRNYLLPVGFPQEAKVKGAKVLQDIIDELGPAVDGYPAWHPLVHQHDRHCPETIPSERTGYKGLDHTVYFANGFITCPYHNGDDVFESVSKLDHQSATITAEKIDASFYDEAATPILVKCAWSDPLGQDKLVPKNIAVPLMIEYELPSWRWAERAERCCLLYTSPSPRDLSTSRMPSSA